MRKVLLGALVAVFVGASWLLAQGPLTPIAQLRGRTDSNGYLMLASGSYLAQDGPLTPIGQLRGRTDSNGYLLTVLTGASITAGSATGLTVNETGKMVSSTYKVTIAPGAFVCAAVTCDLTIGTLPANTWLTNVTANLATVFACSITCTSSTLSIVAGKGAGGAEYLASLDADASTGIFGDADAELGTLLVRAAAIQGGTFTTGTQAVVVRLTSGTGNIGTGTVTNLSTGSLVVWLTTVKLP